jgi:pimeloyl-ACP methyl ester carboxylesterase
MSIFSAICDTPSYHRFGLGTVFASAALASLLAASPASADPEAHDLDDAFANRTPSARDVLLKHVELHPGVTADIHLRVLSRPGTGCGRNAMVAVHGSNTNASSLEDLGDALLASSDDGAERACRFIAVDLPGHGESSLPVGTLYGDLSLEDYAAAVLGTLDRLEDRGIHTTTLMGHSMGGGVVVLAQQSLVANGSSLRDAYDVRHVVLFAPAIWPPGISCAICQNTQLGAIIGPFESDGPVLGPALQLSPAAFVALTWSRPDGTLAPDAPNAAQVDAAGGVSPESLTAIGNLLNTPAPLPVDSGIFGRDFGSKLNVVSFENDTVVLPTESEALHRHLTGESSDRGWTRVDGANAVHGMPISDPVGMLAALEGRVNFR